MNRANEKVGLKTDDEVISREEEKINPNGFRFILLRN